MRPINNQESYLRTPFNNILGFKANLLVLRSLFEANIPLSISIIAERTGLTSPGVHKAVSRLLNNGVIRYTGTGKRQLLELRLDYPLVEVLQSLFKREREYFESTRSELQHSIRELASKPDSAWINGKVAMGTDEYGDPLTIMLLSGVKSIDTIVKEFRHILRKREFEKQYDLTVEIKGVTLADLNIQQENLIQKPISLWGIEPEFYGVREIDRNNYEIHHYYLDNRSIRDSKSWTKLLKLYPEIIRRTIVDLDEQIKDSNLAAATVQKEWKEILESMSYQRLKKLLESDSERSVRLRQSLPFWRVLTEKERAKFEELRNKTQVDYDS